MNAVLVLIDVQNDFLASPRLDPQRGDFLESLQSLVDSCRNRSVPVIHVRTLIRSSLEDRMPHWKEQDKRICLEGTNGSEAPETLQPLADEKSFRKTFFSAFTNPSFETSLRKSHPDVLILAGIHLHACIRTTALDAYQKGFAVWIVEEAVASDQPVHAAITRDYLSTRGIRFVSLSEVDRSLALATEGTTQKEETRRIVRYSSARNDLSLPDVPIATEKEVAEATQDARRAWLEWRNVRPQERAEILLRLADLMKDHSAAFNERMATEVGKPVRYAQAEIARTVDLLRNVARYHTDCEDVAWEEKSVIRYRPVGVVGLITPWNNPVAIPIGKIAPALLYGNTIVWKPSPAASDTAFEISKLLDACGCPPGVLNLVFGDSSTAQSLMNSNSIDAVTFSGSLHAGYTAQAICSARMLPFQGEFGGNNAAIVWPDCNLNEAAALIAEGAFGFSGQRCTANRRAIVHADCYELFLQKLQEMACKMDAGDPFLPQTRIGPLISSRSRQRVAGIVQRAAENHCSVLPVQPASSGSYAEKAYHPPVIVCCDEPQNEIVQEETFGPVLVIQKASSWKEAIHLSNGVKQGLVMSIFTASQDIQSLFLQEAEAGILKINRATSDAGVNVPFGGWKSSGVGPPEHGPSNREFYTRTQSVYL
jgi:acyl-CoA reductase-like NAD-dependent aldehyde dehydrogenase/nicotinamidase-related amidase